MYRAPTPSSQLHSRRFSRSIIARAGGANKRKEAGDRPSVCADLRARKVPWAARPRRSCRGDLRPWAGSMYGCGPTFRSDVPGTSSMLLAQSGKCPAEGRNPDRSAPFLRGLGPPSEPGGPGLLRGSPLRSCAPGQTRVGTVSVRCRHARSPKGDFSLTRDV
jgi:hypothetical protein